jgi:hypothetical protein
VVTITSLILVGPKWKLIVQQKTGQKQLTEIKGIFTYFSLKAGSSSIPLQGAGSANQRAGTLQYRISYWEKHLRSLSRKSAIKT